MRRAPTGAAPSRVRAAAVALAARLLLLGGCSGGSSGKTSFTRFVKREIEQTDETRAPVEINGKRFRFDEDPRGVRWAVRVAAAGRASGSVRCWR